MLSVWHFMRVSVWREQPPWLCFCVNSLVRLCEHSQGLQGSHLNLSQTSAQRHTTYFLLNNKAVNSFVPRRVAEPT